MNDLIREADIVEYISQYIDLEEKSGEYWGLSPFKEEKTPSFSVRRETGTWYDFSSGKGGNLFTFIKLYHSYTNKETAEEIEKFVGFEGEVDCGAERLTATMICKRFSENKNKRKSANPSILPDDYMDRYQFDTDKLSVWEDEGISLETMKAFDVMYDPFSNCIVYPIRNKDGVIVNIGGRTLYPDFKERGIRKYTYFKKWGGQMDIVYGLYENMKYIEEKHEVIVFEGMKSVLLAREYGYKNAVAILTSHLNAGQMKILARLGCNVVFALDKDVDVKADRRINALSRYVNVRVIRDKINLLDDKDSPVDKGADVFLKLYSSRERI